MFLARRYGLRAVTVDRYDKAFGLQRTITGQPNSRLELDPTLRALLKDEDISLAGKTQSGRSMKELEVLSSMDSGKATDLMLDEEDEYERSGERKSPAAFYGSQQIGQVVLPNQLQNTINVLISGKAPQLEHRRKESHYGRIRVGQNTVTKRCETPFPRGRSGEGT